MSDQIDERDNAESRVADEQASQTRQGATSSGPVEVDAPVSGQTPAEKDEAEGIPAGTAGGSPLAGVLMSDKDAEEAVSGDTGPEHHGRPSESPTV